MWKASFLPGSALYFFVFSATGSLVPFLPIIWQEKGMSDDEIGVLAALRPLLVLFAAPAVGAFATKHNMERKVLYVLIVLFAVNRSAVLITGGFLALAALEAAASLSQSPVASLIDTTIRNSFGAIGYGPQRMWGAIGFGTGTFLSGIVYDHASGGYESVVVLFVVFAFFSLLAAFLLPVGVSSEPLGFQSPSEGSSESHVNSGDHASNGETELRNLGTRGDDDIPNPSVDDSVGGDGTGNTRQMAHGSPTLVLTTGRDFEAAIPRSGQEGAGPTQEQEDTGVLSAIRLMFSTPQDASFFMAVALSGLGKGVITAFLFVWLKELGASNVLLGVAQLVMCAAEVPFFYLSGPLIERIGARNVVALAQLGYIARFLYYSVLRDPWWVLPAELLHGLTFAALWAATTDYAHRIAPAHMRATMQGTVKGLKQGIGLGLGAILGGVLYSSLGGRWCFGVCSALPIVSLLLLAMPPWKEADGDRWEELEIEKRPGRWDSNRSMRLGSCKSTRSPRVRSWSDVTVPE